MKHIKKFNEAKKNKEVDHFEELDELFFSFIEELSELGRIARSEQSHSNFVSTEKNSVDDAMDEYGKFLEKVNKKFDDFKLKYKTAYNS